MIPPSLPALLRRQHDLATRAQLLEAGMTESALRWALCRSWQVVLPGVVHVHRVALTREQRLVAALLYAGPASAITGASALRWYGIDVDEGSVVRVAVPRQCASRRVTWVDIRRTSIPFGVRGDAVRVVTPDRAVVEAARGARDHDEARALVIEAVQRRVVTVDDLISVNLQLGRRGSLRAARAIEAAADGAWSLPEHRLSRLVGSSVVLPRMWLNPALRADDGTVLISPDGWFDDVGLAVMVHSRAHHAGTKWATTVERDGQLIEYGVTVVALTPTSIEREPQRVLLRIEKAYLAARTAAVRPAVTARPRYA